MIEISSDAEIMEFFPAKSTPEQTAAFIERMKPLSRDKGYGYSAVDELSDGESWNEKLLAFKHQRLLHAKRLEPYVLYKITDACYENNN